ncbi:CGNR zinc finger domain-containing protein [Streptomyces sp. CAI 127]|uniref:CGNR zinc finger domain-containing protein n=1 Tax=Streptomyces sp. CAI 127 TaxID=1076397 RepID=UPI001587015A|nr:CGNR zinc finger domain-containing protein [Streptomyces sp. CAI 127]NUW02629.1 CGNR zinc finger domain-containing protein [Streptomyces sp. CAI 127]
MTQPPGPDPRPLTGEPLAIDLLNTRWIDGDGRHDLLDTVSGLAVWLDSPSVREHLGTGTSPTADRATLDRLLTARTALDALAATAVRRDPAIPEDSARLNEVLAHGRIRRTLGPDGMPDSVVEVDEPSWLPAWYAAENWLRLVADRPDRIRHCANDACVLHFHDVSKNGTRRWCSMAGCGNRAKAQRHYARRTGA